MEDGPLFVVQRHHATTLHFDLRLQVGDVLVSWAVPKGPSLDPAVKRLAVRTGDHDLDHATFEGRGAGGGPGTVVVWDTGRLANLTRERGREVDLADAVASGHLKVELFGLKLTGAFALTRTRMGDDDRNWILVKLDDDGADRERDPVIDQPESVLTGRTNEDLEPD